MDFSGLFVRRKLLVIISIILLLLAIPLGTFLVQRQTQLKSRADAVECYPSTSFECDESYASFASGRRIVCHKNDDKEYDQVISYKGCEDDDKDDEGNCTKHVCMGGATFPRRSTGDPVQPPPPPVPPPPGEVCQGNMEMVKSAEGTCEAKVSWWMSDPPEGNCTAWLVNKASGIPFPFKNECKFEGTTQTLKSLPDNTYGFYINNGKSGCTDKLIKEVTCEASGNETPPADTGDKISFCGGSLNFNWEDVDKAIKDAKLNITLSHDDAQKKAYECLLCADYAKNQGHSCESAGAGGAPITDTSTGKVTVCNATLTTDELMDKVRKAGYQGPFDKSQDSVKKAIAAYNEANKANCNRTPIVSAPPAPNPNPNRPSNPPSPTSPPNSPAPSTPAAVKPATPTGLYGHCSGAQASVFWNAAQNAQSYNLKIDNSASNWKGTSVYFGGASGTSYQLSVQAVNGNQTSDYSAAISITCR